MISGGGRGGDSKFKNVSHYILPLPLVNPHNPQNMTFFKNVKTKIKLHTPFLPYFDTQHSICIFTFLLLVLGGLKNLKIFFMISKTYFN